MMSSGGQRDHNMVCLVDITQALMAVKYNSVNMKYQKILQAF